MPRIWTPEARKAQSEAIRRWQPWDQSTGPKTDAGKVKTRLNAQKHGNYNAQSLRRRSMSALLRRQRAFLKTIRLTMRLIKKCEIRDRTIIPPALINEGIALNAAFDAWFAQNPAPRHCEEAQPTTQSSNFRALKVLDCFACGSQ